MDYELLKGMAVIMVFIILFLLTVIYSQGTKSKKLSAELEITTIEFQEAKEKYRKALIDYENLRSYYQDLNKQNEINLGKIEAYKKMVRERTVKKVKR